MPAGHRPHRSQDPSESAGLETPCAGVRFAQTMQPGFGPVQVLGRIAGVGIELLREQIVAQQVIFRVVDSELGEHLRLDGHLSVPPQAPGIPGDPSLVLPPADQQVRQIGHPMILGQAHVQVVVLTAGKGLIVAKRAQRLRSGHDRAIDQGTME